MDAVSVGSATEQTLDTFFAWCASDVACAFHGGESTASVTAAFDAAWASADATFDVGQRGDSAVLDALADGSRAELADALSALELGSADQLLALSPPLSKRDDGTYTSFIGVWQAVTSADRPWPVGFTRDDLEQLTAEIAGTAPRAAPMLLSRRLTVGHWSVRPATPPLELAATSAPPFLILAGEEDVRTPLSLAETLRDTLNNGSYLVTVAGPGHGQLFRASGCPIQVALAFLDDPTSPPTTTRCE